MNRFIRFIKTNKNHHLALREAQTIPRIDVSIGDRFENHNGDVFVVDYIDFRKNVAKLPFSSLDFEKMYKIYYLKDGNNSYSYISERNLNRSMFNKQLTKVL